MSDNPALTHPKLSPIIGRGVDAITRNGTRGSVHIAEAVIAKAAWDAYTAGRHDAIRELVTTEQAAHLVGIDRSSLHRLATRHEIGWKIANAVRLFRPEDVERLRALSTGKRGRPRKPTPVD